MSKKSGSLNFGTSVVNTEEYIMMANVMIGNGSTPAVAAMEIEAIDDMLSMQRIACIANSQRYTATGQLRKNSSLVDMCDKRIDQLLMDLKAAQ